MAIAGAETAIERVGWVEVEAFSSGARRRVLLDDTRNMLQSPFGAASGAKFPSIERRGDLSMANYQLG